jgi:hypothetical protein
MSGSVSRPARTFTLVAPLLVAACCAQRLCGEYPFAFSDATESAGLWPAVGHIAGHGAMWGDVDGDGYADLYVGTFGGDPVPYGSKPNMFFRNRRGQFVLDAQPQLQLVGRANGGVFADLDNDGDLDLYVTNHAIEYEGQPHFQTPNALFRNDGEGRFSDVSETSGACRRGMACRSACVLDFDGDGLLDLLVGECFFQGGQSRSRLWRNQGGLRFEDATAAAGLPDRVTGFGVAACDVTEDGWPDVLLGGRHGGNRLFVNDGHGRFQEVPASHADFSWSYTDTPDDTACGVCFGDVNRDGLPDVVIGSHFDRPWFTGGVPLRLYIHRGVQQGLPRYEEITQTAGLVPLPMKSPHVEVQDFDNDGWADIYTSIIKFAGGRPYPVIFRNLGLSDGLPRFYEGALAVNDFPNESDRQIGDVVALFERIRADGRIVYMAPGPTADYDRDGRLDLFLPNWWVDARSLLLHNDTPGGNWLQVEVRGGDGVNVQGIGAQVRVYEAGRLGESEALLGAREIAVGYGYASGQEAVAHFGLGPQSECDVEVRLPHGRGQILRRRTPANQRLVVKSGE